MKNINYIFVCLMLCFFVDASYAELIKYTDKNGTLCFVDDPGKVPKKYRHNIIRDEEEVSMQITDSQNEAYQQGSINRNMNDNATICYNGFLKSINGHDITDFIAARGHSSSVYNVSKNPEHKRFCADLWCRHRDESSPLEITACMKEKLAQDTTYYYHFIIVKDKMILSTDPGVAVKLIDEIYNIDPNTPHNFKR